MNIPKRWLTIVIAAAVVAGAVSIFLSEPILSWGQNYLVNKDAGGLPNIFLPALLLSVLIFSSLMQERQTSKIVALKVIGALLLCPLLFLFGGWVLYGFLALEICLSLLGLGLTLTFTGPRRDGKAKGQ